MSEGTSIEPQLDGHAPSLIGVLGLWHLGCVTAACLAEHGFDVIGVDLDAATVTALESGRAPLAEPGLDELVGEGLRLDRLRFSSDISALRDADVIWVAFDTPIDSEDRVDAARVLQQTHQALLHAPHGARVIVSSQLPVGSIRHLAESLDSEGRDDLRFACVPENLRLGQALDRFRRAERIVAGVRDEDDRVWLSMLLTPFTEHIEWMSVESAEMTKHALNGFLATSIAYINEIAALCEQVGANAAEVSRGVKSDRRIGWQSYLDPGDVFAGGTLARDISTLNELARRHDLPGHLIAGVAESNASHRAWARRAVTALLRGPTVNGDTGSLAGKRVAVWGLTYKPGTDTLRRSSALELCDWLSEQGAMVRAHDPAIKELDRAGVEMCATALAAAQDVDALVICTPWPAYREVDPQQLIDAMRSPTVIDAGGHLQAVLGSRSSFRYARVGTRPS